MTRHLIQVTQTRRGIGITPSDKAFVRRVARAVLCMENADKPCQVQVSFTDNDGIQPLNAKYRQVDAPTDVLSFPYLTLKPGEKPSPEAGDIDPSSGRILLGELVISLEKAREQAKQYGHSEQREIGFLVAHGVLHLLGYDHEPEDTLMRQKQAQVLRSLDVAR